MTAGSYLVGRIDEKFSQLIPNLLIRDFFLRFGLISKKSKGVAGQEETRKSHRGRGQSWGESPTGRGDEEAGGGGKSQSVVGES